MTHSFGSGGKDFGWSVSRKDDSKDTEITILLHNKQDKESILDVLKRVRNSIKNTWIVKSN